MRHRDGTVEVTDAHIVPDEEIPLKDQDRPYFLITYKDGCSEPELDGSYNLSITTKGFTTEQIGEILRTIAANF